MGERDICYRREPTKQEAEVLRALYGENNKKYLCSAPHLCANRISSEGLVLCLATPSAIKVMGCNPPGS